MRWSELNLDSRIWTLPGSRTKNGVEHVVPLSTQVFAIISAMPRIADSKFVFTIAGDSHIGGFDRVKTRLDARMQLATSWVFHDLRRTAATVLVANNVDMKTAQVRLGHADAALTLKVYAQATTEQDRVAAALIDSHFADVVDLATPGEPVPEAPGPDIIGPC